MKRSSAEPHSAPDPALLRSTGQPFRAELFRRGPADNEIARLTAMKNSSGKTYIPQAEFNVAKCTYNVYPYRTLQLRLR
jgi:hypothetical protein